MVLTKTGSATKILIADLIGLSFTPSGLPDHSEVQRHIEQKGGVFHYGPFSPDQVLDAQQLHFFYQPDLSTLAELTEATAAGQYDAIIAAATVIPQNAKFRLGGVRIGAGTGNMQSLCWGGASGLGGQAVLMNTPGFNAKATAQMAMKALLRVLPDLPVEAIHARVVAGDFDTGKDLPQYPTSSLAGKRIAILGYGNIGREMARLASAFGLEVVVFARAVHRPWIESQGYHFAETVLQAAQGADIISPHLGLGVNGSNVGVIDKSVLAALNPAAVVINYDRGELVDIAALDWALSTGKVSHAAIDADIFKDAGNGSLSGPMLPYLAIYPKYPKQLSLLPHVAADTEHHSRVAGAKQAVDQLFELVLNRRVINRVGDLPAGYLDAGSFAVTGISKVSAKQIESVPAEVSKKLGELSATLANFWQCENGGSEVTSTAATIASNQLFTLMSRHGLLGPHE